ncbi:hypothetical protein P4S64_16815 [Vibrio sp. M60_M31a]
MDLTTYQGQDAINLDPDKDVTGVAGYINGVKNKKLDIPAVKLADGPAGLRIQPLRDGDSNTYYAAAVANWLFACFNMGYRTGSKSRSS